MSSQPLLIHVTGFPFNIRSRDLAELFSRETKCDIKSVNIVKGSSGSNWYAMVQCSNQRQAQKLLDINNKMISFNGDIKAIYTNGYGKQVSEKRESRGKTVGVIRRSRSVESSGSERSRSRESSRGRSSSRDSSLEKTCSRSGSCSQ